MTETTVASGIDYEMLRLILERELKRTVSLEEATATGNSLLKIYRILLE